MPPVFGPSPPSKARLKSLAGGSGTASRPSHNAKSDTSAPSRSSSTSSSPCPARLRSPSSSSASVRHTITPLPAASPSALTTHGARATSSCRAVGTPAAAITSLANSLEPSIRAAAAPGPNTEMPARRNSSPTPATSGASGPTTTSPTSSEPARPSSPSASSACTGWQCPSRAIPGLPGAACNSSSRRRLRQLPGKRVLAPARADQQDVHRASVCRCSANPPTEANLSTPRGRGRVRAHKALAGTVGAGWRCRHSESFAGLSGTRPWH